MKKLLIPGTLLAALAFTIIIACNKEVKDSTTSKKEEQVSKSNDETQRFSSTSLSSNYTINSTYEFMVFVDTAKMNNYLKELIGSTHQEIRDFQDSIKFTSLGKTYYSGLTTDTITADQAPLYFLNSDGVVQIQDVIFKQLNQNSSLSSWDYFLTLLPKDLSTQNYTYLASGSFQSTIMNKFADGEALNKGLFKFIQGTPSGHQASGTVNNSAGKFWGTTYGQFEEVDCGSQCYCIDQPYDTYVFWIHTSSCTTHYSTCSGTYSTCD